MYSDEDLDRELARASLRDYCAWMEDGYVSSEHTRLVCERLEALERGDIQNLLVMEPPSHSKTYHVSERFPSWYLGRRGDRQIILASYAAELAEANSRRARDLVMNERYPFNVKVKVDVASTQRWETTAGGVVVAAGVRGGITGKHANLLIIDDPVKDRSEADSESMRDATWKWYGEVARTRLMGRGQQILTMCMTGDTLVRMADGTERPLRNIRKGDSIATYDSGALSTSTVTNHKCNGPDHIYKITMTSGTVVHANARHPFLAEKDGNLAWTRLRNLTTEHRIVTLPSNGVSGVALSVTGTTVLSQPEPGVTAHPTTTRSDGLMATVRHPSTQRVGETLASAGTMELGLANMKLCSQPKTDYAQSAANRQATTFGHIGAANFASTTTMTTAQSAPCYATTVTSQSPMPKRQPMPSELLNTSDFTLTKIQSIEPAGVDDVFDVQVDRTENFIANGLVSHNTRWHEDDLAGRILESSIANRWEILRLPALAEAGDVLGRAEGEALWPEYYPVEELADIRAVQGERAWQALYQQRPVADTGNMIQDGWWRWYAPHERPRFVRVEQFWDTAYDENVRADYTVCATWGLAADGSAYLLDVWRDKVDWPHLHAAAYRLHGKACEETGRSRVTVLIEDRGTGKTLVQALQKPPVGMKRIPALAWPESDKSRWAKQHAYLKNAAKEVRLQGDPIHMIEAGMVYLPRKADWHGITMEQFLEEHAAFPNGAHDDVVDTTIMMGWRFSRKLASGITHTPYQRVSGLQERLR